MLISIGDDGFQGLFPGISPQKLPGNAATVALNCDFRSGGLRPLKAPIFCVTPTKAGTKLSIYRYGQDIVSDTQYFFHWLTDVDAVRTPVIGDTQETTYYTGDGDPKETNSVLALSGAGTAYPNAFYTLGIPIPAATPTLAVSGTGTGAATSRTYVYTYVSGSGQEGPNCAASAVVSVQPGQAVTLSGMSVAPAGSYNILTKRIYRAISGTSSVGYQFVAEIPIANTTYADSVADTALGSTLESADWIPPPANMVGLTGMRNGMLAGFLDDSIYFCEPFRPWAWPARYRVSVGFKIVGMKASGSSLIVTTKGNPYLITGSDPQSMDVVKMASMQACVSKRSMVDLGDTVMFASPDGMCAANEAGVVLVTEKLISQEEWQAFKPESILGAYHENKYIGFYNTGSVSGGFIIDFSSGAPRFSKIDTYATAAYNDLLRDALFLQVGNDIVKYASGTSATLTWESKPFILEKPDNFSCARVDADSYPITFKWYSDGALKSTVNVVNEKPFRLPSGFRSRSVKVGVSGVANINKIYMASNISGLKAR